MKKPLLIITPFAWVMVGCKPDNTGFDQSLGSGLTDKALAGAWFVKSQITLSSSSYPDTVLACRYTYVAMTKKLSFGLDNNSYTISKLTADSPILNTTISGQIKNGPVNADRIVYKLAHK
jgi:hypothetical protein